MKRLAVLGSTGSIGVNTLNVVRQFPDRFQVESLSAGRNIALLREQVLEFRPRMVSVIDPEAAAALRREVASPGLEVVAGVEGLIAVATLPEVDQVVSAIVGAGGLIPTLAAIKAGKGIALANKESLVMAGKIVMEEARKTGAAILPVDSEHSAIFQALAGHRKEDVDRLILTASGGPFLHVPASRLQQVTVREALRHPRWEMGRKITIDSATLMNKGLEVIEAHWLFGVPVERIQVRIHPQSVVHSMVEYIDGSVVAQLGIADMRIPIAYALAYPGRLSLGLPALDLCRQEGLTFSPPDLDRFPCLGLAYQALGAGETLPAVLNAVNEVAVHAFLEERMKFTEIPLLIRRVMEECEVRPARSVEDVLKADHWARERAKALLERGKLC
jgi:1-deoxy-D-xylulose-5-phosphate reductoisomerase